jgi:hypothetical protein
MATICSFPSKNLWSNISHEGKYENHDLNGFGVFSRASYHSYLEHMTSTQHLQRARITANCLTPDDFLVDLFYYLGDSNPEQFSLLSLG